MKLLQSLSTLACKLQINRSDMTIIKIKMTDENENPKIN